MLEWSFILKGFLIGIISAVPIGPVALMTIRNSVNYGHRTGLSGALGGSTVDTLCALVATFTISSLSVFIDKHMSMIQLIGGLLVVALGVSMFFSKIGEERSVGDYSASNYFKAVVMSLSNPGCLAVMLALFAGFGMEMGKASILVKVLTIAAVFLGSASYWNAFTRLVHHFGKGLDIKYLYLINRLAGIGVAIFGLLLMYKGIF